MSDRISYAYYPGCSQTGSAIDYDMSTREVMRDLGVELNEVPDWTCCGSSPAHAIDGALSAALSARNLEQARTMGAGRLTTPCPSCLANLRTAARKLRAPLFKERVDRLLDEPYQGGVTAKSTLEVLFAEVGPEKVAARVILPLTGLKIVPYYGCLTTRLKEVMQFDSEENPVSMDALLRACGAEVPDFSFKTECCGASLAIPKKDAVVALSGKIMEMARLAGADAVAVACPLCQMNLDLRRGQINRAMGTRNDIPVFYFTQLIGLALGFAPDKLGVGKLCVNPKRVLDRIVRS